MEEQGTGLCNSWGNTTSRLFEGKKFWLSLNIPQRSRFKELIEQHGGIVRQHDKDADIILVDHTRKNLPTDSYSYQYVQRSIHNGKLEPLEAYRAGPSSHRPVGATHIPTRSYRNPFTLEDDQILWDWMQQYEGDPSAPVHGHSIFKLLAEKCPRHTYQSYRERYKKIRGKPRPGGIPGGQITPEKPVTPRESTGRGAPAHQPSVLHENEDYRTSTRAGSSRVQEVRKRKRSPDDEAVGSSVRKRHEKSRPNARVTGSVHLDVPDTHEPLEAVRERKQASDSMDSVESEYLARTEGHKQQYTSQDPASRSGDDVDPLFLELPFLPSSPEPDGEGTDVNAWIDARLDAGSATQVIEALRCTSMNPKLADEVLPNLVSGMGIPSDMRGVWTPDDDRCIEGKDARDIDQLLKKHGTLFFNMRWEYLGLARTIGLDD